MTKSQLPSPEILRKILRYEPDTGKLFWRIRHVSMFRKSKTRKAEHTCARWNSRNAGKEALTATTTRGYSHGGIFGKSYKAHRVCYTIHHGKWPTSVIDHINGDTEDNRIANLRSVSHVENCKNQKKRCDNTSGVTGVRWAKRKGKWVAQIGSCGKVIHLGYFADIFDAISARQMAEVKFWFHANHGRP